MQSGIIAVYDRETAYAMRLSDYMNRQGRFQTAVHCYREEEALQEAIDAGMVKLVLAGETGEKLATGSVPVVRLTEEDSCQTMAVYKYQPAGKILRGMEEAGLELLQLSVPKAGSLAQLRAVYAPTGGCLKTTLALVMGALLAEKRRVLYLNLEAHSGFRVLMNRRYPMDLSDILAYQRQGEDILERLPDALQTMEKLFYLAPAVWPEDIYGTRTEEWTKLLSALTGSGRFDEIILDVGQELPYPEEILMCCDKVYRPIQADAVSQAKNTEYDRYLSASGRSELLSRMVLVSLEKADCRRGCASLDQWQRWENLVPVVKKILQEEDHR